MDDDDVSCECQQMAVVLKPTCKLKIDTTPSTSSPTGHRWYVGCDKHGNKWVELGPDGYWGRPTWDDVFALGVNHQALRAAMW